MFPKLSHRWLVLLLFLFSALASATTIQVFAMVVPAGNNAASFPLTQLPQQHDIDCLPTSYSLDELIECITTYMPPEDSNAFVTPTITVTNDWKGVVANILAISDISECSTISLANTALDGIYAIFPFTDNYTGNDFCVAMEVEDDDDNGIVDRGWGTLIVNPLPDRYLSIDIPHPIEDNKTNLEGIQIFQGVGAHTFIMAGANRYANDHETLCQSGEKVSDVAHCTDNLFFHAAVAIYDFHTTNNTDHTAIQFHGMTDDPQQSGSCPDVNVYITHGSATPPVDSGPDIDSIVVLRDNLRALQEEWAVAVPGESEFPCGKNGTDNVEGRYLNSNGTADVCGPDVSGYNGKFIHIEQHPDSSLTSYRNPAVWIEALKATFPALTPPVSTTEISFQNGVAPDASYMDADDTMIRGKLVYQDNNYGSSAVCAIDGVDEVYEELKQALLRWDISSLPNDSVIHHAEVTLNVTDDSNANGYHAYAVYQDWVENQVNWLNYDVSNTWVISGAFSTADRSEVPVGRLVARETGLHTFNINPLLVQSWLDTPASNNGLLLTNLANTNDLEFECDDGTGQSSNLPRLTIHYSQSGGGSGTPTPTPTATITPTATATPTVTPTPTATPEPAAEIIYMGFSTSPTLGGVDYSDEDIIAYDASTDTWSLYFDGSDVGLSGSDAKDVDAFYIMGDGSILLSLHEPTTLSGLGDVNPQDIIRFTPTSTGSSTAGSFSWYFDGSDVGLDTADEDVVGIAMTTAGNLLISTDQGGDVGFAFEDEDLLEFTATQLGADTAGSWSLFFDGSDVGLSGEDIRDFWVDSSNNLYVTFINEFEPVGDRYDVFLCTPGSLGDTTSCISGITLYWDGSEHGVTNWRPDSFFIAR